MRSNISSLEEAFLAISAISERMVRRSMEETSDLAGLSRELASLSNNTVFNMLDNETELGKEGGAMARKNLYYRTSKEISGLASRLAERYSRLDTEVHQAILSLLDVVTAYSEMMGRHEKGLLKEHKIAAEKIGMIKLRDLRGALATDIEMRNLLETNIQQNEIVLTDLESRQVSCVSLINQQEFLMFYIFRPSLYFVFITREN